ncbi:MAG: Serine--tRNA ligase, mitochondrial [Chaenotheca gracillima]|nr:MAG: Serine--tRNA ligase, mitochondrial [Chaenotheca gracillima]
MAMATRLLPLPWRNADKDHSNSNRLSDVFSFGGVRSTSSTSNLQASAGGHAKSQSSSTSSLFGGPLPLPGSDVFTDRQQYRPYNPHWNNDSVPPSPTRYNRHDRMHSATQLALATSCATAVNGIVSHSHSPAVSTASRSTTAPLSSVSAAGDLKSLPVSATSYLPAAPIPVAELPGSILMENEGYPTSPGGASRRRWDRGAEKLSPGAMKLLGLQEVKSRPEPQSPSPKQQQGCRAASDRTSDVESIVSMPSLANLMTPSESPSREGPRFPVARLHTPRRSIDSYHARLDDQKSDQSAEQTVTKIQILEDQIQSKDGALKDLNEQFSQLKAQQQQAIEAIDKQHSHELMCKDQMISKLIQAPSDIPELGTGERTFDGSSDLFLPVQSPPEPTKTGSQDGKKPRPQSIAANLAPATPDAPLPSPTYLALDIKSEPQFIELERKLALADQLSAELKEQIEAAKARDEAATQQLAEAKKSTQIGESYIRSLKRESRAMRMSLTAKTAQIKELELKLYFRDDDINEVEDSLQRVITVQREMEDKESKRNGVERENETLRLQLSEKTTVINRLEKSRYDLQRALNANNDSRRTSVSTSTREMEQLPPTLGQASALSTPTFLFPASPNSVGISSNNSSAPSLSATAITTPSPYGGAKGASPDGELSPSEAKAQMKHMSEDIKLYKLDVRGYKKDVRARDRQIGSLEAKIQELEARLGGAARGAVDNRPTEPSKEEIVTVGLGIGANGTASPPSNKVPVASPPVDSYDRGSTGTNSLVVPLRLMASSEELSQGGRSPERPAPLQWNPPKAPVSRFSTSTTGEPVR